MGTATRLIKHLLSGVILQVVPSFYLFFPCMFIYHHFFPLNGVILQVEPIILVAQIPLDLLKFF